MDISSCTTVHSQLSSPNWPYNILDYPSTIVCRIQAAQFSTRRQSPSTVQSVYVADTRGFNVTWLAACLMVQHPAYRGYYTYLQFPNRSNGFGGLLRVFSRVQSFVVIVGDLMFNVILDTYPCGYILSVNVNCAAFSEILPSEGSWWIIL